MTKLCLNDFKIGLLATITIAVIGCSAPDKANEPVTPEQEQTQAATVRRFPATSLNIPDEFIHADPKSNANRNAYFGDLHVHSAYSFDAFAFGTIATPYDAYRYAQGEAITHPGGFEVKLSQPLDFYAVTDHAMFLGAVQEAADTSTPFSKLDHVKALHKLNASDNLNIESLPQRFTAFTTFLTDTLRGIAGGSIDENLLNNIARDAWSDTIEAAQMHNRPGKFTTFVAYEYTSSTDDRGNLHRNVIFRDADKLPAMPYSRFHSQNPEGLWEWMDGLRSQGIETLAIPHNSNGSNGQMFKMVDWAGNPLDDSYAQKRLRNEPLVEITQVKGTSETHPVLSDNDEWADFEIMPYRVATTLFSEPKGSYAREALLNGLTLQDAGVANAYQFGFIGASDTHTGAASLEEDNYFSKVGILDATAERRGSVPASPELVELVKATGRGTIKQVDGKPYVSGGYETWGASGVTGVWAEANSRDAIYRAFRRKETFATSGPRMKVRFFGGFDFDESLFEGETEFYQAYNQGVSMGSELHANADGIPRFVAWATRDPSSAPLQRLQIIKGWTVKGEHFEQVYDVACSDGGSVNPDTHRCPDNGADVNLADCSISAGSGATELKTVWQDPDFNPAHRAFYYVRALENPTCRWSTWDAIRANIAPRPDLKATIQERVWSSPIWYVPG